MQYILKEYCKTLPDISLDRHKYDNSNSEWFLKLQLTKNEKEMHDIVAEYKNEILGNDKDLYYNIVYRDNCDDNYNLNWHLDDRILQKHQIGLSKDLDVLFIKNNYEYSLWNRRPDKKILKRTIIIYLSSINEDFLGGELEFLDEVIIPKSGITISFNNYDLHRVRKLKAGHRKVIVIKIYND